MKTAAKETIPRKVEYRGKRRRKVRPWWDAECDRAREDSMGSTVEAALIDRSNSLHNDSTPWTER